MIDYLINSWKIHLKDEINADYFQELLKNIEREYEKNTVYPPKDEIFKALNENKIENIKVVILGQDPYHGPKQANGLAFSVKKSVKLPPSLRNIFKEIQNSLEIQNFMHGDLECWSKQGVLLLNSYLTVRDSEPLSHANLGWEKFTDRVINEISIKNDNIVFLLWGSKAKGKKKLINDTKHHILESSHPSPLSAHRGFLGCGHFKETNRILKEIGKKPIDWEIK